MQNNVNSNHLGYWQYHVQLTNRFKTNVLFWCKRTSVVLVWLIDFISNRCATLGAKRHTWTSPIPIQSKLCIFHKVYITPHPQHTHRHTLTHSPAFFFTCPSPLLDMVSRVDDHHYQWRWWWCCWRWWFNLCEENPTIFGQIPIPFGNHKSSGLLSNVRMYCITHIPF